MLFTIITILLIICDQASKIVVVKFLKPVGTTEVIKNIFSLTYVENRGAAFGIMQNSRWIFISATIIITLILVLYKIKTKPQGKIINTSLCLLLAGAMGNLIDRILRGYVVDMLEVTFINYPVFNIADCFVVIGAIILAVYILFIYKEPEKENKNND